MNSRAALWLNVWAGAVVWFLTLLGGFALAPWACSFGWKPALPIISLVGMLITAVLALKAWNQWHQVGRVPPGELGGMKVRQVRDFLNLTVKQADGSMAPLTAEKGDMVVLDFAA